MFTRRQAMIGAAATAMLAAMPPMAAFATEDQIAALPRERVKLVAPPFVHAHDQVAKGGPKVIEFTMTIEEKPVVIDDDGTVLQGMTFNGSIPGPMMVVHEGDYVYIPAGVPHQPFNPTERMARALIARTDPNEQESVVLLPESMGRV